MNRLVLIDGNAILHRAYHALPPLTSPDGKVVNAVYGFTAILFKIFHELKPTHMAVAFDRPKPTFRKEMFEGYQAKRPKMDDDLVSQIDLVHQMIRAFHIPIYELDGYEADDVIGTLAKQSKKTQEVVIVTGDRDILQLVDDRVRVFMPTKGVSEGKLFGKKDVKERMGVGPSLIADFKGLAGDSSDNYPGVAGIGPKTAVSLLETFGSVEGLYKALQTGDARIKKLSPAVVEKLQKGADSAKLSKDLATIRTDVLLDLDLSKTKVDTLETPEAIDMLESLRFQTLLRRLMSGGMVEEKPVTKPKKEIKKNDEATSEQQGLF